MHTQRVVVLFTISMSLTPVLTECAHGSSNMTSIVTVEARFGDRDDEFGFSGIGEDAKKPVSAVACFTVTPDAVYIFDAVKRDIKMYSIAGKFQRAIPAIWDERGPLLAEDMVVAGDHIHLLIDFNARPANDPTFSRFQLFTFDRDGTPVTHRDIDIPELGKYEGRTRMVGTVRLLANEGTISVYDEELQSSFTIVRNGKSSPKEKRVGRQLSGSAETATAVRFNHAIQDIEILNSEGAVLKTISDGYLAASSPDGFFAVEGRRTSDGRSWRTVTVYDSQGQPVGNFESPGRKSFPFRGFHDRFHMIGKEVYEIQVGPTSVQVFNWSQR